LQLVPLFPGESGDGKAAKME